MLQEIIDKVFVIFSTRELALISWFIITVFVIVFFVKSIRKASRNLIKCFFTWKISVMNSFAIIYCSSILWGLWELNFWDNSLLKDTIFWFLGSGLFFLVKLNKSLKQENYFKNIFIDNLKLILIMEFVMNFHQFSLITELFLLPIITLLALVKFQAENDEKSKIIVKPLEILFIVLGLIFLGLAIKDIISDITNFANYSNLKSFLLPIILSISFIPCIYLLALFMQFGILFTRLGFFLNTKKDLSYAKRRLIWKSKFSLKKLKEMSPKINSLYNGSTREDIKKIIS